MCKDNTKDTDVSSDELEILFEPEARYDASVLAKSLSSADTLSDEDDLDEHFGTCDEDERNKEPDEASSPPSPIQGTYIITEADLDAAIKSDMIAGSDGEASSVEQANRLAALKHMRSKPWTVLHKPHLIADLSTIDRLEWTKKRAPNMAAVIAIAIAAAQLSAATNTPLQLPAPLILVGPPAAGKTRIMRLIAESLQMSVEVVEGSALADQGPLTGYNVSWKGARPGCLARTVLSAPTSGVMIIVDEAEKVNLDHRPHPLDVLLPVLEQDTAKTYRDEYWGVPMRADLASFVFCTNTLRGMSEPFLDRCLIVEVPPLDGEQMRWAMERVIDDVLLAHGLLIADFEPVAIDLLLPLGFRRARAVLTIALGRALGDRRDWPSPADIKFAISLLNQQRRDRMGFLP